jgi:hypothetical protein
MKEAALRHRLATPSLVCAVALLVGVRLVRADEQRPPPGQRQQAPAQEALTIDKWKFTLFNPTPKGAMREFDTDRPDVTESPYTVDAGHFQYESSLLSYTHSNSRGEQTDLNQVLPSNVKAGLLKNMDLQFVFDPYDNLRTKATTRAVRTQGGGPMQLRLKTNLFGNDGGKVALGLLPFITFPTGSDAFSSDHVEGGFIVPVAVKLPAGFDLGTEVRFDFLRNDANDGYGVDFTHTLTIGHNIIGKLAGYAEYVGVSPHRTGATYAPSIGMGVTYPLAENIQLDGGVSVGLGESAADTNVFIGLSFRI